jgi:hypothetical protein
MFDHQWDYLILNAVHQGKAKAFVGWDPLRPAGHVFHRQVSHD